MLTLDHPIPDFLADSTQGQVDLYVSIDGSWSLVLVVKSFDPVATTELCALAKTSEFAERKVKVIVVCADLKSRVDDWKRETEALKKCDIDFPIVVDDGDITRNFGGVNLAVVAAPDRTVKWHAHYPPYVGHNIHEIVRVIDALRVSYNNEHVATGVNWMAGEDVLLSSTLSKDQAKAACPKGYAAIFPWFRLAAAPDDDDPFLPITAD